MTEATDNSGNPMNLHPVFTICDAADGVLARQYALEFMSRPNRWPCSATEEEMMNLRLRPAGSGSGEATHWGCIREAWTDEMQEQQQSHANEWAGLPSFRCYEMTLAEVLDVFDLEVC